MRSPHDYQDKQRRKDSPGQLAIVTNVREKTEDGTRSTYSVDVAIVNSGSQSIEYETRTVDVSGGDTMQMSEGSGEGPPGWNTEEGPTSTIGSGPTSGGSSPSDDNPLQGQPANTKPEVIDGSYSTTLGDGDELVNKRIVANGSPVSINARGSNWRIKNVGIEGPIAKDGAGVIEPVVSAGSFGIIENVYVEGAADNSVFINAKSAGKLSIVKSHFRGETEDSVYGSPPGNFPGFKGRKDVGQGGVVEIVDSYSENSGDYGFRLGSNESKVVNSTVVNAGVALANLYGNPVYFDGCNVAQSNTTLRVGDMNDANASDANQQAKAVLNNCQFNGGESNIDLNEMAQGPSLVEGSPGSSPDSSIPSGVPTSAQEAAGI